MRAWKTQTTSPFSLSFLFMSFSHIFTLPYLNSFSTSFYITLSFCWRSPFALLLLPAPHFQCVCSSFPGVFWTGQLSYSPALAEQPHLRPLTVTIHKLYFGAQTDQLEPVRLNIAVMIKTKCLDDVRSHTKILCMKKQA